MPANIQNQEIISQSGVDYTTPSQPKISSSQKYSVFARILIPYKYLTLLEKIFLFINISALLFLVIYLIKLTLHVAQGEGFIFGIGDWILLFAITQSISALRYKGLTRIPVDKLDEKLQNQLVQSEKFESVYSIKFAIFLWLLVVALFVFSLYLNKGGPYV